MAWLAVFVFHAQPVVSVAKRATITAFALPQRPHLTLFHPRKLTHHDLDICTFSDPCRPHICFHELIPSFVFWTHLRLISMTDE
jgi:hypothetical protein